MMLQNNISRIASLTYSRKADGARTAATVSAKTMKALPWAKFNVRPAPLGFLRDDDPRVVLADVEQAPFPVLDVAPMDVVWIVFHLCSSSPRLFIT